MSSVAPLPVNRGLAPAGVSRRAVALAAAAGVLLVGGLTIAAIAAGSGTGTARESVSGVLYTGAGTFERHGASMLEQGRRIMASASRPEATNREHWIAVGQHLIADGQSFQAFAQRLRNSGALLGSNPTRAGEVDLGMLASEGRRLATEGRATVAHGRAMVELARSMAALAREPGSSIDLADIETVERDAAAIAADGERIAAVGESLQAFAEQMRRSLGR